MLNIVVYEEYTSLVFFHVVSWLASYHSTYTLAALTKVVAVNSRPETGTKQGRLNVAPFQKPTVTKIINSPHFVFQF